MVVGKNWHIKITRNVHVDLYGLIFHFATVYIFIFTSNFLYVTNIFLIIRVCVCVFICIHACAWVGQSRSDPLELEL